MNKDKINMDDIRDISIKIVDELVDEGIVRDCIDTDCDDEFIIQDIITLELQKFLNVQYNEQ